MVRVSAATQPGSVSRVNEDCYLWSEDLCLFVVADGMGGGTAGQVASRLAIESIENFVRRSQDGEDYSWPCGIDTRLTFHGNRLRTAIQLANRRVFHASETVDGCTGMATTVVSALIRGTRAVIGHVGDSRVYVLADGELSALTRDDSWAATVFANGARNPIGAARPTGVLTQVLGAREKTEIHITEYELQPGTMLLLCTDGLHDMVHEARLRSVMVESPDLNSAAQTLVDEALAAGARDDVTALIVQYDGNP
jgi:PPM family protein phosphatase